MQNLSEGYGGYSVLKAKKRFALIIVEPLSGGCGGKRVPVVKKNIRNDYSRAYIPESRKCSYLLSSSQHRRSGGGARPEDRA